MAPWMRLGRLFETPGRGLARTHAMLPTPYLMADRIRVFFAACDGDLRGRVYFADVARDWPHPVLNVGDRPVLDLGEPGAFDQDGVNPSQILVVEDQIVLLYIGWRRGSAAEPYTLFAGMATSRDEGLSFRRQTVPLLSPCAGERLFRTAPFVLADELGWKMYYIGGDEFINVAGKQVPIYSLRQTRSARFDRWTEPGRVLLSPDREAGEVGFGRPVLWRDVAGAPSLLVSVRTTAGYRLCEAPLTAIERGPPDLFLPCEAGEGDHAKRGGGGCPASNAASLASEQPPSPGFARSPPPASQGETRGESAWTEVALKPLLEGPVQDWESHMTCFGAPCAIGDHELLFYNGDGFGRSGVGLAWRPRV